MKLDSKWPALFDHAKDKLVTHKIPWLDEPARAQFVASQDHCLWLSSCWPAFAPSESRDIIAGDFFAWIRAGQQQHELHLKAVDIKTYSIFKSEKLPVKWMQAQLEQQQDALNQTALPGWYGGLSYPYAAEQLGIKTPPQRNEAWPDCQLGFARWVITLDEAQQSAWMICKGLDLQAQTNLIRMWHNANTKTTSTHLEQSSPLFHLHTSAWTPTLHKTEYTQGFNRIKEYIRAGDTYQVNFTQRFDATWHGHPLAGFLKLKQESPSPYAAYWQTPYGIVCSHSPELLLKTAGTPLRAITKPIKGTTPRQADPHQDQVAANILRSCPKNRAENTMIVDLLRNDLSRYALPASMKIPKLCTVESYAHIHHLVSEITTLIQSDINPFEVLLACFPGGSITGAPKKRAMEIIDELEHTPRDIYCGSIGFWDSHTTAVFNITIRTFLFNNNNTVSIWAGGGIVQDSQAESEYAECFHKVDKLMGCLSALSRECQHLNTP